MKKHTMEKQIVEWINTHSHGFAWRVCHHKTYRQYVNRHDRLTTKKICVFSEKGVVSILGIWNGRALALETVHDNEQINKSKAAFLNKYKKFGGVAATVTSLEDAKSLLNKYL